MFNSNSLICVLVHNSRDPLNSRPANSNEHKKILKTATIPAPSPIHSDAYIRARVYKKNVRWWHLKVFVWLRECASRYLSVPHASMTIFMYILSLSRTRGANLRWDIRWSAGCNINIDCVTDLIAFYLLYFNMERLVCLIMFAPHLLRRVYLYTNANSMAYDRVRYTKEFKAFHIWSVNLFLRI